MRAVLTLVDQDAVSEAVIGSGEGHSIEEWLDCCFTEVRLPWRAHVTLVPNFRPEYERLISRPGLLKSLGWAPEVTFAQLAKMMIAAR